MPTEKQAFAAVFVCQLLSNLFQPLYLFRYDSRRKEIYIIAGNQENLEIIITEDGNWEFVPDET